MYRILRDYKKKAIGTIQLTQFKVNMQNSIIFLYNSIIWNRNYENNANHNNIKKNKRVWSTFKKPARPINWKVKNIAERI